MPITQIQQTKSITVGFNPSMGEQIIAVYTAPFVTAGAEYSIGNLVTDYKIASFGAFVKNLKAYGHMPSLPETPLPDFQPTDSDVVKRQKALEIEWTFPRKQLNLYISSEAGWQPVGSLSMLNPFGYPYRIYSLLDMFTDNLALEMGRGQAIGVQVEDVGWGFLEQSDRLTIHGSVSEEIFLSYEAPVTNVYVTGSTGSGTTPPPTSEATSEVGNDSTMGNDSIVGNF